MNIEVRKAGVLKAFIRDVTLAEIQQHIRNGYPDLLADYEAGVLTVTENPGLPAQTPEDIAAATAAAAERQESQVHDDVIKAAVKVLFNHENRLRALEGKPAITRDLFIDAVRRL